MEVNDNIREFAKQLRRELTPAETILWQRIRGSQQGFKFYRQRPIDRFIVDFVCTKSCVIVEIDGETHVGREEYDRERTEVLESLGYNVLRFWNHEVYEDMDMVLDTIWLRCDERKDILKKL